MSRANRGKHWEQRLASWHRSYELRNIGFIVKTDPPIRMLGGRDKRGVFRATFTSGGPPDFVGVLHQVAVVFDAKSTRAKRLPMDCVTDHQAADLERAHRAGAVAFVAVEMAHGTTLHARLILPWSVYGKLRSELLMDRAAGCVSRGQASKTYTELLELGAVAMGQNGYEEWVKGQALCRI